jgi:hypothetical protein
MAAQDVPEARLCVVVEQESLSEEESLDEFPKPRPVPTPARSRCSRVYTRVFSEATLGEVREVCVVFLLFCMIVYRVFGK